MKTVTPKFDAQKMRDQVTRAVRTQVPILDDDARSLLTFVRTICPSLNEATWGDLNRALPPGWCIEELTVATFTISVKGRRA